MLDMTLVVFPTAWVDFLPDTLVSPDVAVPPAPFGKLKKFIQVGGQTPVVEINPHSPRRGGTKRIWHVRNVYSHISVFERVTVSHC